MTSVNRITLQIKALRLAAGLSAHELATRIGRSAQYIYDLERARFTPSLEVVLNLAGALNVPVGSLFDSSQAPEDTILLGKLRSWPEDARRFLHTESALKYVQVGIMLEEAGLSSDKAQSLVAALAHAVSKDHFEQSTVE